MRHISVILAFVLLLGLTSCRKEISVPNQDFENLFGKWEWVSSSGGIDKGIITPTSENYHLEIEYKKNGIYKKFKDGRKINKMTFLFEKGESIFSPNEEYLIMYSAGKYSKKGVIPHSFSFIGSDTLILNDECYDCYSHVYVKKE